MSYTDGKKISVRKATGEELARYRTRRDLKDPVFTVQAGELTLLVEYDMQANAIPFVGQLGVVNQPPVAAPRAAPRPPPVAAAPAPSPPVVAPPPKAEEPLRLIVELTDDCYLDLEVDGQTVLKDSYRRGTRDSFEAKNNFTFKRIGNAAGVILMLNDKQLPPLGDDGQVIKNRVYDRAFVEKLTAQ